MSYPDTIPNVTTEPHKPNSRKVSLWTRIWRCGIHIPVGAFNAWLFVFGHSNGLGPSLGIMFAFAFLICYEMNEDWHLKDGAWVDNQGWLVGYFLFLLGMRFGFWVC